MNRRRIAVLTGGGDAPGMNACLRAVVRCALAAGVETWGVEHSFQGLATGAGMALDSAAVAGIVRRGGTVIGAGRFPEFLDAGVQRQAVEVMREQGLEGLVVAGGDGSLRGALALHKLGFPTVGIPCSIDNDVPGTDLCIGPDTAVNTALEAIDRIKDTASSHHRAMVVEVMGHSCGYLAEVIGLTCGAEMVITPERRVTLEQVFHRMREEQRKSKRHFIIVLAEGAQWHASDLQQLINRAPNPFEARHTVLGYIMRGGAPSFVDRMLATRMGVAAVDALLGGQSGVMTAWLNGKLVLQPLEVAATTQPPWREDITRLMDITTR